MSDARSQRKFSNIKLTCEFHYRHMGLWVCLTIALVLIANLFFHLFVQERWSQLMGSPDGAGDELAAVRRSLMIVQAIEIVLFCAAIVLLAKITSHRIAGPYLRLQKAFREVCGGDLGHQLKFREYDHLAGLEKAFSEMLTSLRARSSAEGGPDQARKDEWAGQ